MRKIDLTPYIWQDEVDSSITEKVKPALQLRRILTAGARGLNGEQLLKADDVAQQIAVDATEVLLEEADWEECCQALKDLKGLGAGFTRLARNVLRAPQVKVKEADEA